MPEMFTKSQRERIHSRLLVIANGNSAVNAIRSEYIGGIRVRNPQCLRELGIEEARTASTRARAVKDVVGAKRAARGKLKALADDIECNVFLTVHDDETRPKGLRQCRQRGRILTSQLRLSELRDVLEQHPEIDQIEIAESIRTPTPLEGASAEDLEGAGTPVELPHPDKHQFGAGVLVGVIDVGGFDFAHPDFVHQDLAQRGKTRFASIWDQGSAPGSQDGMQTRVRYGRQIRTPEMNDAIAAAPEWGVAATDLVPQTQMSAGSHATHVASIAAGNHTQARRAMLAGVLVSLPAEDTDRRLSFYDTTRIAHAVDYLVALKDELEAKALVINISLGTNGGAHDGSEPMSRWLDACLTKPGRAICVAAGNAGQERPTHESDIGFVTGRIHTEGRIEASQLERDLEWIVVGNGIADISENELEIWYSAQDRFEVKLRPPGGTDWLPTIRPGEHLENQVIGDSKTVVSIYNELYHPANGDNKISIFLSPFMTSRALVGVKAGCWTVKLVGQNVRDGHYHGWIERDDPRRRYRGPDRELWQFPSFFHGDTNVDLSSVSSLACGPRVIGVANLDQAAQKINITSSQGPTRDGRNKPDVAAPGTKILAANGFYPERPWVEKTGTSMASPYVARITTLMLAVENKLTAAQIGGILKRTARPLPGDNYQWTDDAGYGVIDPVACVEEAAHAFDRRSVTL